MTTKMVHNEPELDTAFKRVHPTDDWRGPIDAYIREKDPKERNKIIAAVMFYTTTKATMTCVGGDRYRVLAAGYRNGPAGP